MKSPRDGFVAEIMRRTRAQYHYAIRKLKRNAIAEEMPWPNQLIIILEICGRKF